MSPKSKEKSSKRTGGAKRDEDEVEGEVDAEKKDIDIEAHNRALESLEGSDGEEDEESLLTPYKDRYGPGPASSEPRPRVSDTIILKAFPAMIICHAFCCEAPFAVLEGILKTLLYLTLGVILAVFSGVTFGTAFSSTTFKASKACFREGIIFLFSAITLIIPCSAALTVYCEAARQGDDFEVGPIPTLIGNVDPRRYYVFESGDASLSENPYNAGTRSMDSWRGVILHPPGHTWDVTMSRLFGTPLPERMREIELVEEVRDRAVESLQKEKKLTEAGWLPVR